MNLTLNLQRFLISINASCIEYSSYPNQLWSGAALLHLNPHTHPVDCVSPLTQCVWCQIISHHQTCVVESKGQSLNPELFCCLDFETADEFSKETVALLL